MVVLILWVNVVWFLIFVVSSHFDSKAYDKKFDDVWDSSFYAGEIVMCKSILDVIALLKNKQGFTVEKLEEAITGLKKELEEQECTKKN